MLQKVVSRLFICLLLSWLSLFSLACQAAFENTNNALNFDNQSNQFVNADQAFTFSSLQQNDHLLLDWQVKPGYYLYQHQLRITGQGVNVEYPVPQGIDHHDEFFGDVVIYTAPLSIDVRLINPQPDATLTISYQGCAEAGFCYPPETRTILLAPIASNPNPIPEPEVSRHLISEQQQLANSLSDHSWSLALFFLLGIGLAFTPCVFPMYPIITSIILGQQSISKRHTLGLALIYVQGMAITYSALGLIVASAGIQFQAGLQSPVILMGISILFVVLALSMFGVYTLQLPNSWQTKLTQWSGNTKGGTWLGVFTMGAISGLICSPCTTAPLSGALLYVAQSGDLLLGALALYLLSLGMGVPLILVAVFGQRVLPRSGLWMDKVKVLFGFILLAAPIFLLERILPSWLSALLWSGLGLSTFAWLYWQKNQLPFGGWKQTSLGIIAVLGMVASLKPIFPLFIADSSSIKLESQQAGTSSEIAPTAQIQFIRIETVSDLNRELAIAAQNNQPVMLDLYADWCVACKEFEHKTFSDNSVFNEMARFHLIQADVTKNRPQDFDLLEALNVMGLPTIVFWNAKGTQLDPARVTGFMDAKRFLAHLQKIE